MQREAVSVSNAERKVGILYICIGRYDIFWSEFFESCENNFLPTFQKEYFVFTDSNSIEAIAEKVHLIPQEDLGWPGNTLNRFTMFLRAEEQLKKMDFLFFFNANCSFIETIDETALPGGTNDLVFVQHPGHWNKPRPEFPYEDNPLSLAAVDEAEGNIYVCGGINGGTSSAYLTMCRALVAAIETDRSNDIVAKWHDESHLNRYFLSHGGDVLDPGYCFPEGWKLPFARKILIRDKRFFGGHAYLRGDTDKISKASFRCRLKQKLRNFFANSPG